MGQNKPKTGVDGKKKKKGNKGTYYRLKTKKWFEQKGYATEYLERFTRIFNPKTKQILFIKRDLFGADGLSMNGHELVFWNSVLNRKNIAEHIKDFLKHPYPKGTLRWIIVWELRAREPEIVEVE